MRTAPGERIVNLRVTSGDAAEPPSAGDAPPAPARGLQIRREMLADFCKMLVAEARLPPRNVSDLRSANGNGNGNGNRSGNGNTNGNTNGNGDGGRALIGSKVSELWPTPISVARVNDAPHLSRRLRQTLDRLLAGDGEKQIAGHLRLSRHTVHVYIKSLYRCFGVNSRGELLARFVASTRA